MSNGGDRPLPPTPKDPPTRKSSLRRVLLNRRERDTPKKSSSTPPTIPPKILWDVGRDDRKELARQIDELETGGYSKAGALKSELQDIEKNALKAPVKALSDLTPLREKVTNVKVWMAKIGDVNKVDGEIGQLETANHALAGQFRGDLTAAELMAETDPKAALSKLTALGKDTAGALAWAGVAARVKTAADDLDDLDRKGFEVQGYIQRQKGLNTKALTKPGQAMVELEGNEKIIAKYKLEQTPKYQEYLRRSQRQGYEITRISPSEKKGDYDTQPVLKKHAQDMLKESVTASDLFTKQPPDVDGAIASLDEVDKHIDAITKHEGEAALTTVKDTLKGSKNSKDSRKKLTELAKGDPKVLMDMARTKEGQDMLDDLAEDLGTKVTDKAEKEFLVAAVKGRFGLDLVDGDLSTKALPQIYKMFKEVPSSHTHGNPALKTVRRAKGMSGASYYNSGDKKICLTVKSTSKTIRTFDTDDDTSDQGKIKGEKVNYFDHTTLHEIGHAVDQDQAFMINKGKDSEYGGWQKHTPKEIAYRAALDGRFDNVEGWTDLPDDFRTDYMRLALLNKHGNIQKATATVADDLVNDDGMKAAVAAAPDLIKKKPDMDKIKDATKFEKQEEAYKRTLKKKALQMVAKSKSKDADFRDLLRQAIEKVFAKDKVKAKDAATEVLKENSLPNVPQGTDLGKLAKSAVTDWAEGVRLKGDSDGLWEQGVKSKAFALSDGRIYQQSYTDSWYSYESAARGKGISSYQFRSPVEWFAECYAAYFLKKLDANHVMSKYLDTLKGS